MTTDLGGPTLLVVAKAPVPGLAKTRIAATTGEAVAAELAAASLLDTLTTVIAVGTDHGWPVVVAMTGDLTLAARSADIADVLSTVTVIEQRGDGLGERLAHAHLDAAAASAHASNRGIVQVGMDTPQLTADDYADAGEIVRAGERTLGRADDGGWWLLGLPDAHDAAALVDVPMSTDRTAELTQQALGNLRWLRTVQDMDTWRDAQQIAADMPPTQRAQSRLAVVVDEALSAGVSA